MLPREEKTRRRGSFGVDSRTMAEATMRIKDRDLVAGKDGEMCRMVGSSGDISRENRGRKLERRLPRNITRTDGSPGKESTRV